MVTASDDRHADAVGTALEAAGTVPDITARRGEGFHALEPALELGIGRAQRILWGNPVSADQIDSGEQQVTGLV